MAAQVSTALLTLVKNYLNITWTDEATDAKVSGLIEDGMVYLDGKAGESNNYEIPGEPRTLLKEYVRYARDGATEVFEENFLNRILAMQNRRKVGAYEESTISTQ